MLGKAFKGAGTQKLIEALIWIVIVFVSLWVSKYVSHQIGLIDEFIIMLVSAAIISIFVQIVKSHNHSEDMDSRWFVFYFLVYVAAIWVMKDFVLLELDVQTDMSSFLLVGVAISLIILAIEKVGLRWRTLPWISLVLALILGVSYYSHFVGGNFSLGFTGHEDEQACPIPNLPSTGLQQFENDFNDDLIFSKLNTLIDTSVWRTENPFGSCYRGKYAGQYPDWIYCEDMIVSRWATGSSGTINYRWYTAVVAQWKPQQLKTNTVYVLDSFACENGKKVTVDKDTTAYYIHVARDGSEIKIEY